MQHKRSFLQPCRSKDLYQKPKKEVAIKVKSSCGWEGDYILLVELQKKILVFRDFIDLPPCDPSVPFHQLMIGTVEDLHKLYPDAISDNLNLGRVEISVRQGLIHLYRALRSVSNLWAKNKWIANTGDIAEDGMDDVDLDQLGARVLAKLDHMINIAKEFFDVMDEDEKISDGNRKSNVFGEILSESCLDYRSTCPSPDTPTSFPLELNPSVKLPEEFTDITFRPPFLLPLRIQAVKQLKLLDVKCFPFCTLPHTPMLSHNLLEGGDMNKKQDVSTPEDEAVAGKLPAEESSHGTNDFKEADGFHEIQSASSDVKEPSLECLEAAILALPPPLPPLPPATPPKDTSLSFNQLETTLPPPPLPIPTTKGSSPAPPPPMPPLRGGAPPPPPPGNMAKALRAKKTNTKLKRSTNMSKLYRNLKAKVEGGEKNRNSSKGKRTPVGGSSGVKQGMADAIAEIAKRSTYFQQIEEDVREHGNLIKEIKAAISAFQTKDMSELLKFHKFVEQHLEKLSDETQVLARFEGFPTKKLESLRMAAALYSKLEGIATELKNWKVTPPLSQLLDKVESYFNKIKGEVDALERSKDEETKRFLSQNIHFDFSILVRIKELMVDVSSGCIELALEERREMKAATDAAQKTSTGSETKTCVKLLWQAFQLAFRAYNFAGGQDDRADQLTQKLADEIEADPL
ncbi:hypothetical protein BT93_A1574 [Corymbia citriodora subsp. variegata]|nr:hypothetical protein BT93_A1574 [Corymbia citriodora subsp. variegata]